jgi:hypothetical protein
MSPESFKKYVGKEFVLWGNDVNHVVMPWFVYDEVEKYFK